MIHELSWTCLTTLLLAPTHSCQCCFLPIFVAPRNELLLRQTHIIICQFAMRTQRKTRRDAERHFEKKKRERERASIFANHYYMKFNGNQQFQWLCGILLGHYIEIIVCFWFGKLLLHKKKHHCDDVSIRWQQHRAVNAGVNDVSREWRTSQNQYQK